MKLRRVPRKVLAARVVVNALALAIVVLVLPGIHENTGRPVIGYLVLGLLFGLINAFVKPAFEFVALPFLLGSLGLVVVLVDILMFALLDAVASRLLIADGLVWIVLAGVLLGGLSFLLDNAFGLTRPILLDRRSERAL